jgi:hypothetical protein
MPLIKIQPRQGIVRDLTNYSNEGGWYDSDKVRFRLGFPEQIGGWIKYATGYFLGTCRSLHQWFTLALETYIGIGTNLKFYIEKGGTYYDITPIRRTVTLGTDPFETVAIGSKYLIVNDPGHGAGIGDFVTFSGATTFDTEFTAALLNQEFQVDEVINSSEYQILVSDAAGGASAAGIFGGGAAVVAAYQISVGLDTQVTGTGWGAGPWGRGGWGSAYSAGIPSQQIRLWSQDNYGEDLIINVRGGGIYYWATSIPSPENTRAVELSSITGANQCPTVANKVMISDIDRHVIAIGADPLFGGAQDPLLIRWSSQEDYLDWEPRTDNTAGDFRISSGSEIIGAHETQQQIVVWTDVSTHVMAYTGPPYTFSVNQVSDSASIISPNASVDARSIVFWMDVNNFYQYSGSIQVLPCPVRDYVFKDINLGQRYKVFAGVNSLYNEVFWFYPSADSDDVNRYVIYNYEEQVWSIGTMNRTAWMDNAYGVYPIASDRIENPENSLYTAGYLYQHEVGYNDDGSPMESFVESSDIDIDDGENFAFISRIIPDVMFRGTSSTPSIDISLKYRNYPMEAFRNGPTVTVADGDTQKGVRMRGRQMTFRVSSDGSEVGWRLGSNRFQIQPDGQK